MAVRTTTLEISLEKLSIKIKGTQDVAELAQQGMQQAIGNLLNTSSRVLSLSDNTPKVIETTSGADGATGESTNGHAQQPSPESDGTKPKQVRHRRPKSESPTALMREMKQEGFFKEARSVSEIQERLKLKGYTVAPSTISARLQELTKKKELYRGNGVEEGNYIYKDTSFDASPRSPNPPEEPAG